MLRVEVWIKGSKNAVQEAFYKLQIHHGLKDLKILQASPVLRTKTGNHTCLISVGFEAAGNDRRN